MAGFGLKLVRTTGIDGLTGNMQEFRIAPNNTGPIFTGDLVRLSGGNIVEATGAANNDDFSPLGVFRGCRYVEADGSFRFKPFWDGGAGRSNIVGIVAIPDNSTFLIKGNPAVNYNQASVGARFGVNYVAGAPIYGDSRVRLGAAAATGPLRMLRLVEAPYNAWTKPEPLFEVVFARSQGYAAVP